MCNLLHLDHEGEVSGDGGFDPEGERHDGEGDGAAALGGHSGDHGAAHHRDGHDVAVVLGEEVKVIVLVPSAPTEGEQPPAHFEEDQRDQDPYLKMVKTIMPIALCLYYIVLLIMRARSF